MILHPSVFERSRILKLFMPIPWCVALAVYLLTLSHAVYPGYSATLSAAAAGVLAPTGAAHPIFALAARAVASLDVFTLPVRLNLFSAFCGTLCAMLLYVLVARLILFSACEDGGGDARSDLTDEEEQGEIQDLQPEIEAYNARVLRVAVIGGLFASLLFIFTVPVWSAATRLDNGLFDLTFALAALCLFPSVCTPWSALRIAAAACVFGLGCFDSAVFLLLMPVFLLFVFREFLESDQRAFILLGGVFAGVVSLSAALAAFKSNSPDLASASTVRLLIDYAKALPFQHYRELRSFFPQSGWALIVLQTGAPALVLLFGRQILFHERRLNTLVAALLIACAVTPALLNLSISPFSFFQPTTHLPVFGYAILAAACAVALVSCLVFLGPDDRPQVDEVFDQVAELKERHERVLRGCVGSLLAYLMLLAALTPWRSFPIVDPRRGAFADETAREILAAMKERTWLISNGYIDNHLLIQASMRAKPLVLVSLRQQESRWERNRLKGLIASSPVFEGLNRQRLQNAYTIGAVRFVMEWFTADRDAGRYAMVFSLPDVWTACGYRSVPEGLAFGGIRNSQALDLKRIDADGHAFADRMAPLLSDPSKTFGYVAALRATLRLKAGFAANELGVALEESEAFEAAYQAYARASQIDPLNLSALINRYTVAAAHKLHSDMLDKLKKSIRDAFAGREYRGQEITWILQNYGTIRQPAFYQQQAAAWTTAGASAVSTDKIRKAFALSERAGATALIDDALVYALAGDAAKAESCYLAALDKDGSNPAALSGLSTLLLSKRDLQGAEQWLKKAEQAGVAKDVLMSQMVTLALLKGEKERALALLKEATANYPADLRYWALLADLLLKQGDTTLVEHSVLPEMQKAVKTPNHFLIHAVRGCLLRSKGPRHFKEARLSLLKALSLNAALPDIWNALLELDMALGDKDFIESDARNLLKIDPEHALANYMMGALWLTRGQLQEAEDFLRRSIEKKPTASACNDLAEALRLQKRLGEAERLARRALALDPMLSPASDTLACVLLDAGKPGEAAPIAAQAVSAHPTIMPYQLTLLRAQVKLGDREGVRQRIEELERSQASIPASLQKEIQEMK